MSQSPSHPSIFETASRLSAGRVAFLVDAESYFATLADALERARRSVFIVGWDLHTEVHLRRGGRKPETLGDVLRRALRTNQQLHVHILLWDYALIYLFERQPLSVENLRGRSPAFSWSNPGSARARVACVPGWSSTSCAPVAPQRRDGGLFEGILTNEGQGSERTVERSDARIETGRCSSCTSPVGSSRRASTVPARPGRSTWVGSS